jgi:hypothetical protein
MPSRTPVNHKKLFQWRNMIFHEHLLLDTSAYLSDIRFQYRS